MGAGTFLEPKFVQPAYELLMEAELHNGDIQNAACAYVDLKALRPDAVAPGSKAHSLSEKILGALNGPDPLVMDAQTSTVFGSEQQAGWRFRGQ